MTAVSSEDHTAASSEISSTGRFYLTHVYVAALRGMIAQREMNYLHSIERSVIGESTASVVWDFCTVRIGGTRQTGKTEAIVQLSQPGDLIISYGTVFKEDMEWRLNKRYGTPHGRLQATSVGLDRLLREKKEVPFKNLKRIFVDDAWWSHRKGDGREDRLAKWIIATHDVSALPTLVLVG